jgi:hypothetical protein
MREKFVMRGLDPRIHPLRKKFFGGSPDERSDIRERTKRRLRISRSLSSGAHSRYPLAHPGYISSRRIIALKLQMRMAGLLQFLLISFRIPLE